MKKIIDNSLGFLDNEISIIAKEIQEIKKHYPHAIMSGSGSTYFILDNNIQNLDGYWVKTGLKFIPDGVSLV